MDMMTDVVRMRKQERLTLRDIAVRLGISRTHVYNILRKDGLYGMREYPELDSVYTFARPDDVIAGELGIRLSRVETARRRLGLRKRRYHNLSARRERFVLEVFGREPGPNFPSIVDFVREHVRPIMADKVIAFYVEASGGSKLYDRFLRSKACDKMKLSVTPEIVEDLVSRGVLQ